MFWSNWVKGVCSIVVFAGLIIAIDLANSFGLLETDQGIVIIIGIVLVFIYLIALPDHNLQNQKTNETITESESAVINS